MRRIGATAFLLGVLLVAGIGCATEAAPPGPPGPAGPAGQSEYLESPADRKYDAANVSLPQDYPARSYGADILVERLAVLAEADRPTRGLVEQEFGIRFIDGFARGQKPLGTDLSSAFASGGGDMLKLLNLTFTDRRTRTEIARGVPPRHATCVDAAQLARMLTAAGWQVDQLIRAGHAGGIDYYFRKRVRDQERRMSLVPHPEAFASAGKGPCVDRVHYTFGD
jgi:hypothetical protein